MHTTLYWINVPLVVVFFRIFFFFCHPVNGGGVFRVVRKSTQKVVYTKEKEYKNDDDNEKTLSMLDWLKTLYVHITWETMMVVNNMEWR